MNKGKELAKNTVIIAIGKSSTQFVSFLLLPLYTSILTTGEYGTVDLIQTYIMLLVPIVTLQIEQALFRFLIDVREIKTEKKVVISTASFFCLLQCLIFLLIGGIILSVIDIDYGFFLVANTIAAILSGMTLQISRGVGATSTYAAGSFVSALVTIIFNILFIAVFRLGAPGMLMAQGLGNIACAFFIIFKEKLYLYFRFKYIRVKRVKDYLKYTAPLVPNALSWWAVSSSNRIIVSYFLGISANGILSVSLKFPTLLSMLYGFFNVSWTEFAAVHIDDEDRDEFFSNTIVTVYNLFSSLCIGMIACIPFAFPIFINSNYNEAYNLIPIFIISSFLNMVMGMYTVVYIAMKKTGQMAKSTLASGIISIITHLILIRSIGLYAAAVSLVLAYGIVGLFRCIDISRYVKIKLKMKYVISSVFMFILMFVAYYSKITWIEIIALLFAIVYAAYVNKNFMIQAVNSLFSIYTNKINVK